MITTIDGAGRLVVPQAMRQRLGLTPGSRVELLERDGVVHLSAAPVEVEVEERAYGPVLVTVGDVPPLTDADVRSALENGRR